MTTIVLADDHPMVRQGVRTVLESEPGWSVVGEAADGTIVRDLVARLKPDILIVDLMMPGLNGIEVTQQISQHAPQTRVIVFSMHADKAYVREALTRGAAGYVLKESDASELIRAVHEVLAGRRYLSHTLAERAIASFLQDTGDASLDLSEMLTARERQVLQLAAQGATNVEIGTRLSISPRTAETHRTNLMRKLGLKTQADLLRYAYQRGILPRASQRDE
jgi:DNA-binding NarL/FixJ family response regulator